MDIEEQYEKIYAYCYFKLKDKHIAEDITQETFFKYFNYKNYINRGKTLALLYTIARNLCIDYYRKYNKELLLNNLEEETYIEYDNTTNITIKNAISNLPDDEKEIIMLYFYNDLKINEISKILNISRFSINRRINKSLKYLKSTLKKEDFF